MFYFYYYWKKCIYSNNSVIRIQSILKNLFRILYFLLISKSVQNIDK